MKAVRYHKPKDIRVDEVDDPKIEDPRDAIVRVTSTAICGSDLHIYNGLFPQVRPLVMGHEFMGVVEEAGSEVKNLKKGDRVIVPFPVACGACWFCNNNLPTHCENSNPEKYGPEGGVLDQKGGGIFGYTDYYGGYDGGQAEFARVPYADYGPRKVPDGLQDEQVLFLTDILPTGWAAVDWAELSGGETVAVFGCGPVGLMAQKSAWKCGANRVIGLDVEQYRLDVAKNVACAETVHINGRNPEDAIREMTGGRGADVCIDAVGMEAHISPARKMAAVAHMEAGTIDALSMCISSVRRGGAVSVVGVYATNYDNFPWGQIFEKGLRLRAGQVPAQYYTDKLMKMIENREIRTDDIITHIMPLEHAPIAYKIFNEKQDDCVKVVLKA